MSLLFGWILKLLDITQEILFLLWQSFPLLQALLRRFNVVRLDIFDPCLP